MLRLMLNSHPRLAIPHESVFIAPFYRKLADYGDLSDRDNARRLLDDVSAHFQVKRGKLIVDRDAILGRELRTYRDFLEAMFEAYAMAHGKERWGDKTPGHTEDIDIIWSIFPDAKFVHLVRDGRDVALSGKAIEWMSGNLPKLALDWRWKTTIAHKVGTTLGGNFLEIHFEDLVRHTEDTLRKVCQFIEEPFDPAMLSYWRNAEDVVPAESLKWHRHSVQPPDLSRVDMWKTEMSRAERIIFEQLAGDALDLFGYEREHLRPTIRSRVLKAYYALVKRN